MRFLKKIFGKKEYVFFLLQDKVLNTDEEKKLKKEVNDYIARQLNGWFSRKKIKYVDYYTTKKSMLTFTLLCSFDPPKKRAFEPLLFELYAYTDLLDEMIFQDYDYEVKEFSNEFQKIRLIRIKF